ncbi:hypothetical protein EDD90_5306 [Streptomyces sp. Ag109_O5-1]|nr:hypothetical protein EDD90_5306 [Streptomyces sp. Ag109_O5-1]
MVRTGRPSEKAAMICQHPDHERQREVAAARTWPPGASTARSPASTGTPDPFPGRFVVSDAIASGFRTGSQWVRLPEGYDNWRGVCKRLPMAQADVEEGLTRAGWVDSMIVCAHRHVAGARRRGRRAGEPATAPSAGPAAG